MQIEGDAEIHYNLGQAYTKQRRGEQAVEHFKRAVKLDPTYWQAWLNLGSLNAMQGKLHEAKDIFHRVAQAQPQRAEIWVNLAHVHRSLRQDSSAIDNYLRALTVNPRQPRIYAELLQLYFQRGETKQAKALSIWPWKITRVTKRNYSVYSTTHANASGDSDSHIIVIGLAVPSKT